MHESVAMRVVQGLSHLSSQPYSFGGGELKLPAQPVTKTLALHVRHGIPQEPRRFPRVKDRQDMWMVEPGGELDLALEALGPDSGGELGVEDLQGDRAVVAQSVGEKDSGHAAAPKLPLDAVAIRKATRELLG